ncbi:MAG: DNA-binding response regulator [Spirochaetae bacterium HGW-Spirochaetae-7]|jgi:two-component system phosphate regulon response regulator PhoB|nr:MAG: DNA-binding response regulator [Spirochaetae bacterium HGW-Spirochaetae-7]
MAKATILVIEDDQDIRELLAYTLGKEGYDVIQAPSGEAGLKAIKDRAPSLVVLDVMLPGMDGLELLRKVKGDQKLRAIPVIMASARGEETDIVTGLELGADDYVTKPFSPRVLVARVRTALRRAVESASPEPAEQASIAIGDFMLDAERHELKVGGRSIDLSATEFAIIERLARSPGRVFTRSQIIDSVRGRDYPVTDRSVDVQVLSIRKKLGSSADIIETVRGVGYRFRDE